MIINSGQKDIEVFCVALVRYKLTIIYEINDPSAKNVSLKKNLNFKYSIKVLWDYFCLITNVVPLPLFPYHIDHVVIVFFLTTLTSQHIYSFSAFYNTTIPFTFLS